MDKFFIVWGGALSFIFLETIPASSESVCVVIAIITYPLITMPALIEPQGKLLGGSCLCLIEGSLTDLVCLALRTPRKSSHAPTDQRYLRSVLLLAADRTLSIKAQGFRIHSDPLVEQFHIPPPFCRFTVCNFFQSFSFFAQKPLKNMPTYDIIFSNIWGLPL